MESLSTSMASPSVQNLRDQLHETKGLLNDTKAENERLRTIFTSNNPIELTNLRKCLTAAEADVIKQQAEMDILRRQYEPTSDTSVISPSGNYKASHKNSIPEYVYNLDVSKRLVSLLKVQVGALSKVLHSSQSSKFTQLRQTVDKLIRIVAGLDENIEQPIDKMETAFAEVVSAYEKLSALIDYRTTDFRDSGTMTEVEAPGTSTEDLLREIQDLENELEDVQMNHNDEIEAQKLEFERQLRALKERVEHEETGRKKLQEELQTIYVSKTIDELRRQFDTDLKKLENEHYEELEDEKNATRLALDAVRRAHEEELQAAIEKLRREHTNDLTNSTADNATKDRQAKVIEQITSELSNLSAMYSAKCLENSQMDEKMQALLANKENQAEREEIELQNRRLQRELRQKETTIDELKARISALERRLEIDSSSLDSESIGFSRRPHRSRSRPAAAATTTTPRNNDIIKARILIDQEVVQPQQQQQQHRETMILSKPEVITSPTMPSSSPQSQPQTIRSDVRFRQQPGSNSSSGLSRLPASRRHDQRYHSNPIIPILTPEPLTMDEMRKTLAVPVSERRKFFEHFM
uniref:Uncharacterized protein n=1 Tax=Panagrolaimus sp. PS1159 TaxID=55785 RepID=A0AC35G4X1_9BILA